MRAEKVLSHRFIGELELFVFATSSSGFFETIRLWSSFAGGDGAAQAPEAGNR